MPENAVYVKLQLLSKLCLEDGCIKRNQVKTDERYLLFLLKGINLEF